MTTTNETWRLSERHGALLRAGGPESTRRNPATADAVASAFATSTIEDVDATVAAAVEAFKDPAWRDNPAARSGALLAWADAIEAHADDLASILTSETGKTLFESGIEVGAAARMARHFAAEATRVTGSAAVMGPNVHSVVLREPVGVVAAITPRISAPSDDRISAEPNRLRMPISGKPQSRQARKAACARSMAAVMAAPSAPSSSALMVSTFSCRMSANICSSCALCLTA